MRLDAGMAVESTDGVCGELADVVVDPVHRRVTHLVVKPRGLLEGTRLVPVDAVVSCDAHVMLSWSTAQILQATLVEETEFLQLESWPHQHDGWDVGVLRVFAWPYYPSSGFDYGSTLDVGLRGTVVTYDRVPEGTAEIRRASTVVSSDDHLVGHVDGLVLDPDHGITHIVLDHGHLWGHREITIPVDEVASVATDRVVLRVTRDAIGGFPSVPFHRHPR